MIYKNPITGESNNVDKYSAVFLAVIIGPLWWFFSGLWGIGLGLMFLNVVISGATGSLGYAFLLNTAFAVLFANKALHARYVGKGWKPSEFIE